MGPSSFSLLSLVLFTASLPQPAKPDFADLKIKTRRVDSMTTRVETLYLKGRRQRQEFIQEAPIKSSYVSISQCDLKRQIRLNPDAKLYAESPIVDWKLPRKGTGLTAKSQESGGDVSITVDSVDLGERRQVGHYTARHVRVSVRTEASPGAAMRSVLEERDGWYVDLSELGCGKSSNQAAVGVSFLTTSTSGRQDRLHFKRLGTAPTGFPIEETTTRTETGQRNVSKIELLEFADSPLDPSLFERPPGYTSARHTPRGGFDMTQPETLTNRVEVWWTDLTLSLRSLF
jgi:hypothetical protein